MLVFSGLIISFVSPSSGALEGFPERIPNEIPRDDTPIRIPWKQSHNKNTLVGG